MKLTNELGLETAVNYTHTEFKPIFYFSVKFLNGDRFLTK